MKLYQMTVKRQVTINVAVDVYAKDDDAAKKAALDNDVIYEEELERVEEENIDIVSIDSVIKKVVYNTCYGGFGLSNAAEYAYIKRKGWVPVFVENADSLLAPYYYPEHNALWNSSHIERDDPILIDLVEELGPDVNGEYACLKIKEFDGDMDWKIISDSGCELVC